MTSLNYRGYTAAIVYFTWCNMQFAQLAALCFLLVLSIHGVPETYVNCWGGMAHTGEGGVELPLVALLVAGGNGCAKLLLGHLQKQMPVLVLEGSGGLADLLAFAYHEVRRRWAHHFILPGLI